MRESFRQLRELSTRKKALIVLLVIAGIALGILLGMLGLNPSTF